MAAQDASVDAPEAPARYEPWKVGAVWTYRLTDPAGQIPEAVGKTTTVVGIEDVGGIHAGKLAYRVHIETLQGSKDVFEGTIGDLDVRYRSVFSDALGQLRFTDEWAPFRLKLDELPAHLAVGPAVHWTFTEITTGPSGGTSTATETWQVIDDDEPVTVSAGTFSCLHVRRHRTKTQDYWYARGVGKIKEVGGAQNEELMSFTPGHD